MVVFLAAIDFVRVWNPQWIFSVAIKQYVKMRLMRIIGMYEAWHYHRDSLDVQAAQERTLTQLLAWNAGTEYAKEHNLADIKDSFDFIRTQPLSKYDQYRPYVDRMMQGEQNVLTKDVPY